MSEMVGDSDNQIKILSGTETHISYHEIATKLLKDRFLLTALELHSETVESGKEIPKLKEFFSNPGNFENHLLKTDYGGMMRSLSQATLDSLDLARYSEDGERATDERVAVLEFELRKAKETINALRANLTVATECETPTGESPQTQATIKPHELRALNFLINEYLLQHNYKLTSITFCDENENQDFDDWDDVGLNIARPAELLHLYRESMRHCAMDTVVTRDFGQTADLPSTREEESLQQISLLNSEVERLTEQLLRLEEEKADFMATIERLSTVEAVGGNFPPVETVSVHSATPERFEMIEPSMENGIGETSSLNDTEWTRVNAPTDSEVGSTCGRGEPAGTEDPAPWPPPLMPLPSTEDKSCNRRLPAGFQREVVSRCFVNTTREAAALHLQELTDNEVSLQTLTEQLASVLPKVLPHVITNKREELIPLLVCGVQLHCEPSQKDSLLHLLFNLKKRPQLEERRSILAGVVSLARASQGVGEAELLPHCWELMSHKHPEHRLLVAEGCSALSPYITAGMRNSLVLSILQQLLSEDREEEVRACCIASLALVTSVMDDADKYTQVEELTLTAIQDPALEVATVAKETLLPVLAQWAVHLGWLQDKLLTRLTQLLHSILQSNTGNSMARAIAIVNALRALLPFLVLSVASVEPVTCRIQTGIPPAEPRPGFAALCQGLANPAVFYDDLEHSLGSVMSAFDVAVQDTRWPELDWVIDTLFPKLLDCLEFVDVANEELLNAFVAFFKSSAEGFGKTVTENMIKHVLSERLKTLESRLASVQQERPSLALIPVYLLSVLAPLQSERSVAEIRTTLQRFLTALALCAAPVDTLQVCVTQLCWTEALRDTVMSALWEGVVHPRPVVRAVTAGLLGHALHSVGESMITNHIMPALITLASDPDISVKTATIPNFGTLIECSKNKEIGDKTYCQLQSLLSDPVVRDDHQALLQLVSTLGLIVTHCDLWFRDDVVLPQLAATAAYTLQLTIPSRRLDLASALVTAFSNSVYCSLSAHTITTALLPGLRYLDQLCGQCLPNQQETVLSMIQEAESRTETQTKPMERSGSSITLAMASSNVGQGVEDMKNRVTKMFQTPISRPTNLPNLQSFFRKK